MTHTLSNSEFAQILAGRFPSLSSFNHDVAVFNEKGDYAIFAKETKKGYSSVIVNGKPYGKMNAQEKAGAVAWAMNLPVEIVTTKGFFKGTENKAYYAEGAFMTKLESERGQHWYEEKKAGIISIEKFI